MGWGMSGIAGNQLTLPHLFLPRTVITLQAERTKGDALCTSPALPRYLTGPAPATRLAGEGGSSLEKGYLSTERCSCPIMNWRLSMTTWVMSYM